MKPNSHNTKKKRAGQTISKFLLVPALALTFLGSTNAQSNRETKTKKDTCGSDSTRMFFNNFEVIVIDRNHCPDSTRTEKQRHREEKRSEKFSSWTGAYIGVDGYTTPSGSTSLGASNKFLELDYSKCITFGLNFAQVKFKIVPKYVGLTTGLGIQWNKYAFKNNYTLRYNSDSVYGVQDTTFTFSKNKLTATYLQIPLMFEFRTNAKASKAFHFGLGVIGAFKIGSSLKQKYDNGNFDTQGRIKGHYQLNPFQTYLTARLGYGKKFDVFFNYGLDQVFESGKGPNLRPFTVGLYLPF